MKLCKNVLSSVTHVSVNDNTEKLTFILSNLLLISQCTEPTLLKIVTSRTKRGHSIKMVVIVMILSHCTLWFNAPRNFQHNLT